jgi:hypothetical protein
MTYCLVAHTLVIQFSDALMKHFGFHQFGIAIRDGCEIMVHGVRMMLDLHPYWVVI